MNFLDIIIAIPLVWFMFKGWNKGLIVELATLLALVIGLYVALNFSYIVADWLNMEGKHVALIAFLITFVLLIIAIYALGKLCEKLINLVLPKFINKVGGLLLGVLKVAIVLGICFTLFNRLDSKGVVISHETKNASLLYNPLMKVSNYVCPKLEALGHDIASKAEHSC